MYWNMNLRRFNTDSLLLPEMDRHHIILVFLVMLLTQCTNHMVRCVMTESDVRLVGGLTSKKGTVEIRQSNGSWETTCGVNLGINDLIIICRQLGFTGASRAIANTPYGQSSPPTTVLGCNGDETDFSECTLSPLSVGCSSAGAASCHDGEYIGCFTDKKLNRALSGDTTISTSMSIPNCIQFCIESPFANYTYAGVEDEDECYCGEASDNYTRHGVGTDKNCQSACLGDPTDRCGGSGYIAVFTISMVTPTTVSSTIIPTSIALATSTSTSELTSLGQVTVTNYGKNPATSSPSTTSNAPQTTSAFPLTGNNADVIPVGLYAGVGGGVAAFIILVIIIVIIFILGRRSWKGRKDLASSQRMSLAPTSTPTGINGLGISNASLEETSAAGGSQLGLQASNNATASVPTASGGDKSGLLVNLNPNKSMNIYGGIDDEVQGDRMMPYSSFDTAATVQNNNGRLSVVYAMPDRNGNDPSNDNEGITNEMAPYASVDDVSPMRPRTMPNMNDRLSVVYASPDKNGNGPRNDTSEDFGSLYAIPDKPRGQPDGNDDGIVHGLCAKADESLSGDQYEPDMVENELYTI